MTIWQRAACRISKATRTKAHARARKHPPPYTHASTHTLTRAERKIFNTNRFFYTNSGFVNTPHCYVVRIIACLVSFGSHLACLVSDTVSIYFIVVYLTAVSVSECLVP